MTPGGSKDSLFIFLIVLQGQSIEWHWRVQADVSAVVSVASASVGGTQRNIPEHQRVDSSDHGNHCDQSPKQKFASPPLPRNTRKNGEGNNLKKNELCGWRSAPYMLAGKRWCDGFVLHFG